VVAEPVLAHFHYLFAQRDFSIKRHSFLIGASAMNYFAINRFYLVNRWWPGDKSITSVKADWIDLFSKDIEAT
jgi:hypothetical protein